MLQCWGWVQQSHSLRKEAAIQIQIQNTLVIAADTSVSFARWQPGEQTVDGLGVVFQYSLGSVQTSHFTSAL